MRITNSWHEDRIPVASAILCVLALFWMDEGHYDFRWMKDWGNWFMFLIYAGGLVLGEYLISMIISERFRGLKRTSLIVGAGIPLGLAIVLMFIYGLAILF